MSLSHEDLFTDLWAPSPSLHLHLPSGYSPSPRPTLPASDPSDSNLSGQTRGSGTPLKSAAAVFMLQSPAPPFSKSYLSHKVRLQPASSQRPGPVSQCSGPLGPVFRTALITASISVCLPGRTQLPQMSGRWVPSVSLEPAQGLAGSRCIVDGSLY